MTYAEIKAELEKKFPLSRIFRAASNSEFVFFFCEKNKISCCKKYVFEESDLADLERSKKFEFNFLSQEFSEFIFDLLSRFLSHQYVYEKVFCLEDLIRKAENFLEFSKKVETEVLIKIEDEKKEFSRLIEKAKEEKNQKYFSLSYEEPQLALCKIFKVSPKRSSNIYVAYDKNYNFELVSDSADRVFSNKKNLKLLILEPSQIRQVDFREKEVSKPIELNLGFYQIDERLLKLSKAVSKKKNETIIALEAIRPEADEKILFSLKDKKSILRAKKIDFFYLNPGESDDFFDFLIVYQPKEGLEDADLDKNYFIDIKDFRVICEQTSQNFTNLIFVSFSKNDELTKNSSFEYAVVVKPDTKRKDKRRDFSVIVKTKTKGFFTYKFEEPALSTTAVKEVDEKKKTVRVFDYMTRKRILDIDFEKDKISFYDGRKKVEVDLKTLEKVESDRSEAEIEKVSNEKVDDKKEIEEEIQFLKRRLEFLESFFVKNEKEKSCKCKKLC